MWAARLRQDGGANWARLPQWAKVEAKRARDKPVAAAVAAKRVKQQLKLGAAPVPSLACGGGGSEGFDKRAAAREPSWAGGGGLAAPEPCWACGGGGGVAAPEPCWACGGGGGRSSCGAGARNQHGTEGCPESLLHEGEGFARRFLADDSSSSEVEGELKVIDPPTPSLCPATPSRRWDFPKRGDKALRGSPGRLKEVLDNTVELQAALDDYEEDAFAKSSLPALRSRVKRWSEVHGSLFPDVPLYPLEAARVRACLAVFKASGYKSALLYLSAARTDAKSKGFLEDNLVEFEYGRAKRSIKRGTDSCRQSTPLPMERLSMLWEAPATKLAVFEPKFVVALSCWWLLREIEVAALESAVLIKLLFSPWQLPSVTLEPKDAQGRMVALVGGMLLMDRSFCAHTTVLSNTSRSGGTLSHQTLTRRCSLQRPISLLRSARWLRSLIGPPLSWDFKLSGAPARNCSEDTPSGYLEPDFWQRKAWR
eukprot:4619672-Amphidinium_carterae.2